MRLVFHPLSQLIVMLARIAIYGYRYGISPIITSIYGPRCRFYPSCSDYALRSLRKDPPLQAFKKIALRLLRCHPLSKGGVDLP